MFQNQHNMKKRFLLAGYALLALVSLGSGTGIGQTLQVAAGQVRSEENQPIEGWVAHLDQPAEYAEKTLATFIKMLSGARADKRGKNVWVATKVKFDEITTL